MARNCFATTNSREVSRSAHPYPRQRGYGIRYSIDCKPPAERGTQLGRCSISRRGRRNECGYRARDEKLERVVAIKLLAPGVFTGDEARRRFHKEALALAKLSHAHIAAVYDVGEQTGVDYIVMECVPGESLAAKTQVGSAHGERCDLDHHANCRGA